MSERGVSSPIYDEDVKLLENEINKLREKKPLYDEVHFAILSVKDCSKADELSTYMAYEMLYGLYTSSVMRAKNLRLLKRWKEQINQKKLKSLLNDAIATPTIHNLLITKRKKDEKRLKELLWVYENDLTQLYLYL